MSTSRHTSSQHEILRARGNENKIQWKFCTANFHKWYFLFSFTVKLQVLDEYIAVYESQLPADGNIAEDVRQNNSGENERATTKKLQKNRYKTLFLQ